jgi:hypothetical protein
MADMKKDFQKAIKAIRDGQKVPSEYPKAMMTAQQMRKGTATVNCGSGSPGRNRRATVISNAAFVKWCEMYGIKAIDFEEVADGFGGTQTQIRLTY